MSLSCGRRTAESMLWMWSNRAISVGESAGGTKGGMRVRRRWRRTRSDSLRRICCKVKASARALLRLDIKTTYLAVQEHQVESKEADLDLDVFDPDVLLCPSSELLEGPEGTGGLLERDNLAVENERRDPLEVKELADGRVSR